MSLAARLHGSRAAKAMEIVAVFLVAFIIIAVGWRVVGEASFARQAVVWVANVAMLATIWAGLRIRGQTFEHFGLRLSWAGWKAAARSVLLSIVVLGVALVAFVAGSALIAPAATSASADMSGYDYLQGNLPMLALALVSVWFVSSFGEEVVYRGFLMNRFAELGGTSRASWAGAVGFSALAFGLAHFGWGLVGMVQTTLMGFALALCYLLLNRRLWILVLAHVWLDTLLLVQLYAGASAPAGG